MSIAEIVQESGSPANPELLELQERAREMARYYYKGIATTLNGLIGDFENHSRYPGIKSMQQLRTESDGRLDEISVYYRRIPLMNLKKKEGSYVYSPLFVVDRLLIKLREAANRYYETSNQNNLQSIFSLTNAIIENGRVYRDALNEVLREIHTFPEGKDFTITLIDMDGRPRILHEV